MELGGPHPTVTAREISHVMIHSAEDDRLGSCANLAAGATVPRNRTHNKHAPNGVGKPGSVREHIVQLSPLDQIQFRSYVRFYLFYPTCGDTADIAAKFTAFFKEVVSASPFLAGRVDVSKHGSGILQVCYTKNDVETFQPQIRQLSPHDFPHTYKELCDTGVPPSVLPAELLAPLPNYPDESKPAPVFAAQGNFIQGGLIVTIFVHHGVTDGAGVGLLLGGGQRPCACPQDLALIAKAESRRRACLFTGLPLGLLPTHHHPEYAITNRCELEACDRDMAARSGYPNMIGRVFTFSSEQLSELKSSVAAHIANDDRDTVPYISTNDALSALLWHAITRARLSSFSPTMISSQLTLPVNVRNKLSSPIPPTYFGAANVLVPVLLPVEVLASSTSDPEVIVSTAKAIRRAMMRIDDGYLQEVITLANAQEDVRNVRMAGNFRFGSDLAITTQANLGIEEATLGMGLGKPEWIRKVGGRSQSLFTFPKKCHGLIGHHSALKRSLTSCHEQPSVKDAGVAVILDRRANGAMEVLILLQVRHMEKLVADNDFMAYVERMVE